MLVELMTIAAILLLLSKKRQEKAEQKGNCSVFGQPGFYFTWQEMTHTSEAAPNNPSGAQCTNLKRLASNILDPLRELTGSAIYVNSAFRSTALNDLLRAKGYNAARNSLHLQGKAADIRSDKYNPFELRDIILDRNIPHGELIAKHDYLHVSL